MASVTIQKHNETVSLNSSGTNTYSVTFNQCTGVTAYQSGGTLNLRTVSLSGSVLTVGWNVDYSSGAVAGRSTLVVVEARDANSKIVRDVMAFTQTGGAYNLSVSGPMNIEGNSLSNSYSIISSIGTSGSFAAYPESSWLSLYSLTKTGANTLTLMLNSTENNADPRYGVVRIEQTYSFQPYKTVLYMVITQGTYTPATSVLKYSPNSANLSYNSGSFTSTAPTMQNVGSLGIQSRTGTISISSASIDPGSGKLIVNYGANTGDTVLSSTIIVSGTGLNGTITTSFYLTQGSYSSAVNPIWKTTTVEVAGASYMDYTISTDGVVIYSGRAYQMPGEDNISFEINEIARDYIDNTIWWRDGYQTPVGWQRTFTVDLGSGSGGDYIFTKDWSYEERNYASNDFISLNDPIINEVPAGCFVPICVFSPKKAGYVGFTYTSTAGTVYSPYYVNLNDPRQARYFFTSSPGYKYGFSGNTVVKNEIYKGAADCKTRYVLYYENAYGGVDVIPIQGNAIATDKITSYTTKNAVRVPSRDFSYRRYLNQIDKTWALNTGYLSDEQASKMHHLIESTQVLLYDIQEADVYPVVIDDSSLEYKTYKNQGRKFFLYSFTVKESQSKIRK